MTVASPPPLPSQSFSLFLDVDGTILDIAARPDEVSVPASLLSTLGMLAERLDGALALVSGRTVANLDDLFAPLRLRASGVHGAEVRSSPEKGVLLASEHLLRPEIVLTLEAIAAHHPGTLVENKRFSVAVHYRAAPAIGPDLRAELQAFLTSASGAGLRLLPGHMVFEVKSAGFDKGTAIDGLQAQWPFVGRRPIFIGDDVTDLPGFDQVLALGGLAYSVTTVRPGLSGHFNDPQAVRSWLTDTAAAITA